MDQQNFIALEDIRIAKPCRADWDAMTGDDRTRFCGSCHKNVYDVSLMSREAAQQLIREREGNVCIRLHRREDGTVITGDCPVGITVARRPFNALFAGLAALLVSGVAVANQGRPPSVPDHSPTFARRCLDGLRSLPFVSRVADQVAPPPPVTMMGAVAAPPNPTPTTTPTPHPSPAPTPAVTPKNGSGVLQCLPDRSMMMGRPAWSATHPPTVTMGQPPVMGKVAAPQSAPTATPQPTPALSQHDGVTMGEPTVRASATPSGAHNADRNKHQTIPPKKAGSTVRNELLANCRAAQSDHMS